MREKIFISGAAGFIGFHACKYLLERHYSIIGLDNLNDYYDINLKKDRLKSSFMLINSSRNNILSCFRWSFIFNPNLPLLPKIIIFFLKTFILY